MALPSKLQSMAIQYETATRLRRFMISRGWTLANLARAYGEAKGGVPYDQRAVGHAMSGKRSYYSLAYDLVDFMEATEGPLLKEKRCNESMSLVMKHS